MLREEGTPTWTLTHCTFAVCLRFCLKFEASDPDQIDAAAAPPPSAEVRSTVLQCTSLHATQCQTLCLTCKAEDVEMEPTSPAESEPSAEVRSTVLQCTSLHATQCQTLCLTCKAEGDGPGPGAPDLDNKA